MPFPVDLTTLPTGLSPLQLLMDDLNYLLGLISGRQVTLKLTTSGQTGTATLDAFGNLNIPNYTISLTTNGQSGPATLAAGALNVPNYSENVPSSSTLPVGWSGVLYNNSGGAVADGATVAGTGLEIYVDGGVAQTGTWKNITGASVANGIAGLFVRVS